MRNKPRILIVTSYGHPQITNLWVRFYEKFIMDEVDEVYIVNGGSKYFFHQEAFAAHEKICELTNKKNGNTKLQYFYFDVLDKERSALEVKPLMIAYGSCISTHPHILYNATQVVSHRHQDAVLCFMDVDYLIMKKGIVDSFFSKLETEECKSFGHIIDRDCFCQPQRPTYHSGLFFIELKPLLWMLDSYNRSMLKWCSTNKIWPEWQNNNLTIHKYANFFGYQPYLKGIKFEDIDLDIDCDCGDETLWLVSTFCFYLFGSDKFGRLDTEHCGFHIYGTDRDDIVVNSIYNKNRKLLHFEGAYNQAVFVYTLQSESESLTQLLQTEIANNDCRTLIYYDLAMRAWHWTKEEIDCNYILGRMKNYFAHIKTIPNLPIEMSFQRIDRYSTAMYSKLTESEPQTI